jgi:peptidoglycan hydrolase CwlO-like protein
MKTLLKIVMLLLLVVMVSCQKKDSQIESIEIPAEELEDDFHSQSVSSNNGMLWNANAETTQGIKNMQALLDNYSSETGNSEKLISDLKEEFAMIFKKCTMTGEAHDQLHNYLIPLKTKIQNLSAGITVEKTDDIKKYLKDYFSYFQ